MTKHESGHGIIIALVVIIVVAGIGLSGYLVWKRHDKKAASPVQHSAASQSAASPGSLSNDELGSDLNGVNSAVSQEGQDISNANNALNDQQNEVQVPTD